MVDPWQLPPIVGEIFNLNCKIIFELKNKSDDVYYKVNNVDKAHFINNEQLGPTFLLLRFKDYGVYILDWYVNNCIKYTHKLHIYDDVSKLIFVSCDKLEMVKQPSLWNHMRQDIYGKTVIMHLGDQAYMDNVFKKCMTVYKNNNYDNPKLKKMFNNYCISEFGTRYCQTWKPHASILSNTSNFYLWDDHEISNNIVIDQITDTNLLAVTNNAVTCYQLYQQSFHVYNTNIINDYCYYKYLSSDMSHILIAIERTSRFVTITEVIDAIKMLDNQNKIKRLILCFSRAVLPPPLHSLYLGLFDNDKFMNVKEYEELVNFLLDWMDEKEVVLVGGDVHFGLHGIINGKNNVIHVLISSPITNKPNIKCWLASKAFKNTTLNFNNFTFTTLSTKAKNCYATLDLITFTPNIIYSR